jgi:hypothetical protein
MTDGGRPSFNCLPDGELSAEPFPPLLKQREGVLTLNHGYVELVTETELAIARALRSVEASQMADCLEKGLRYVGSLERPEGVWVIKYRVVD